MTALAGPRFAAPINTGGSAEYPQKAAVKIWGGAIVMVVAGVALPAAASGSGKIVGLAKVDGDRSSDSTGLADGAKTITVEGSYGPFGARDYLLDNDPGAGAIAATDAGSVWYALDDHTATLTSSGNLRGGVITGWDTAKSKPICRFDL